MNKQMNESVLTGNVTNPLSHWESLQHLPNNSWLAGAQFGLVLLISLMFNDVEESISTADKGHQSGFQEQIQTRTTAGVKFVKWKNQMERGVSLVDRTLTSGISQDNIKVDYKKEHEKQLTI